MANTLIKDTITTFLPGSPAVPAYPGQPYLPARYATETQNVCSWQPTATFTGDVVGYGWVQDSSGVYQYVLVDAYGNPTTGSISYGSTYVCSPQTVTTYYPAQPYIAPTAGQDAVASQTIIDLNLGWDAGARSKSFLISGGKVEFKMLQTVVGVVVGINDAGIDAGYANIENAWYFSKGIARIYESGVETFYSGPYVNDDKFAIKRIKGVVTYFKNDTLVYTSAYNNTAEVFLDASLYAGGDSVYDPQVIELMYGEGTLAPLYGVGRGQQVLRVAEASTYLEALTGVGGISATMVGQGANVSFRPLEAYGYGTQFTLVGVSNTSLQPLQVSSRPASRGAASLQPLDAQGSNKIYGDSVTSLAALTTQAQGGMLLPVFALANTAMLYLTGGGTGLTGEIGGSDASLAALDGLASGDDSLETLRTYGQAKVSLAPLAGYASAYEGNNNASMQSVVGLFGTVRTYQELAVVMNADMTVAGVFAVQRVVDARVHSDATLDDTVSLQATLVAVMRNTILAGFALPVFDGAHEVWVLNTDTGASSRYEQFDFNSFAKIGDRYYGCRSDGVYLLEGDDDEGLPVRASIHLGVHNFGTTVNKQLLHCYVGITSDERMVLKVAANGKEYFYTARGQDPLLRTQRIDVGRGLQANYFEFELYNQDGADFDMSDIEFAPVATTRRI